MRLPALLTRRLLLVGWITTPPPPHTHTRKAQKHTRHTYALESSCIRKHTRHTYALEATQNTKAHATYIRVRSPPYPPAHIHPHPHTITRPRLPRVRLPALLTRRLYQGGRRAAHTYIQNTKTHVTYRPIKSTPPSPHTSTTTPTPTHTWLPRVRLPALLTRRLYQKGRRTAHTKHKNTCDIQTHQNHLPFNPHIHNHIHNYTYLAPAREAASTAHEAAHGGGLHRGQDGQHSTLLRTLCFDDLQHPSCLPHTPPSLPRSRACMLHLPCRHANAGDMRVTARMAVLLLCA